MDGRLAVLKKILDCVAVPANVNSLAGRKEIQKAIYLAQAAGLKLGYSFGWYVRGPYSTSLARDYYAMAAAVRLGEQATADLRDDVRERLAPVRELVTGAAPADVARPEWLELLASVHFLRTVRNLSPDASREVLEREKPNLAQHEDAAVAALQQAALLQ